jgi:hypothetical protein
MSFRGAVQYVKRTPSGAARGLPRWRYAYAAHHRGPIGQESELHPGARFRIEGAYWEIVKAPPEAITYRAEDGVSTLSRADFVGALRAYYADSNAQARRKVEAALARSGSDYWRRQYAQYLRRLCL